MRGALIVVAALLGFAACASAQDKLEIKRIAIWPPVFLEGNGPCKNETAIRTAKDAMAKIIQQIGFETVDEGKVAGAIRQLGIGSADKDVRSLPDPEQMLKLGEAIEADYVLAYRCAWRAKSVWVALGPKTKAHCRTSVLIVNVATGEIDYNPEPVEADSTKKESTAETAASLLISMGFTALSGGPKTPHMQRAAQLSIVEVMDRWVAPRMPQAKRKIRE